MVFEFERFSKCFPSEIDFRKFFRKVMEEKLPKKEWNAKNVMEFIEGCRVSHGIPMFKTGYGGEDFEVFGKKAVMGVCWGGRDTGSVMFVGVPEEEHKELKMRSGDWHFLTIKYAPEKYKKLLKYPVEF